MRSFLLITALVFTLTVSAFGQTTPEPKNPDTQSPVASDYKRPDGETRRKNYLKSMFGPLTLARVAATSAVGTFRNSPEEWEKSGEGFGRRFASDFGKNVIRQTTQFGLDEALKLDSSFYRSKKRDLGSKVANALLSTVTARNSKGKRVVGVPRIAGAYVSNIVASETWFPKRFDYKDGLRSGTISLGINAAVNLFRELIKK
ncbi:MAG: hypothetical protein IPN69_09565 [Acidobacteria bacterium]|nr:hypothetical protein [Acidobacteriota bacterium]MBK8810963.1 hypothetical protein [Acidobacteriota bacterium]